MEKVIPNSSTQLWAQSDWKGKCRYIFIVLFRAQVKSNFSQPASYNTKELFTVPPCHCKIAFSSFSRVACNTSDYWNFLLQMEKPVSGKKMKAGSANYMIDLSLWEIVLNALRTLAMFYFHSFDISHTHFSAFGVLRSKISELNEEWKGGKCKPIYTQCHTRRQY